MTKTKIEWADEVWNPVTGCTKVSQGCKNCYAKTLHDLRHKAYLEGAMLPEQYAQPFETVQLHPDRLEMPLRWKKPRRVFVNSMSDLFHERLYDQEQSYLDDVFAVMAATPQHTYQILTKRPLLMEQYLAEQRRPAYVEHSLETIFGEHRWCIPDLVWPLPNVWVGTSISNQPDADENIPHLLRTLAAVRFVSIEPLLGPVDIHSAVYGSPRGSSYPIPPKFSWLKNNGIDWVICGGESGTNARPMHPDWARSLRDQCIAAGVPFFFKQWGEWAENPYFTYTTPQKGMTGPWTDSNGDAEYFIGDGISSQHRTLKRVGKRAAGRLLDGREWNQFPCISGAEVKGDE